jgi:hypothetical protein
MEPQTPPSAAPDQPAIASQLPTAAAQPRPAAGTVSVVQPATAAAQSRPAAADAESRRSFGEVPAKLPLPTLPPDLVKNDPKLYEYWRDHIKAGFDHNDQMFRGILDAFMKPYQTTVWMYSILFAVGVLSFVAAAVLSVVQKTPMYALIFGGLSVVAFIGYFISRPLRSLEENLEFITWLGMIYNTYWTRLAYAASQETVQQDLHTATEDAITELVALIDKHAIMSGQRPGAG